MGDRGDCYRVSCRLGATGELWALPDSPRNRIPRPGACRPPIAETGGAAMKTCLKCNTLNLREARFCSQSGTLLQDRLPESEESIVDANCCSLPQAKH